MVMYFGTFKNGIVDYNYGREGVMVKGAKNRDKRTK